MSTPDLENALSKLDHLIGLVPERNRGFVRSLIDFHNNKGFLTAKQEPWVWKYLKEAEEAAENKQENSIEQVFDGTKIEHMFALASAHLKFPTVWLRENGTKIKIYIAGKLNHDAGHIVFTNSLQYPLKMVFAKINRGNMQGQMNLRTPGPVKQLILQFAADPTKATKINGQKFGSCCFCARELTNKISLFHGYGPICAANFGLPWEGTAEDTELAKKHDLVIDLPEAANHDPMDVKQHIGRLCSTCYDPLPCTSHPFMGISLSREEVESIHKEERRVRQGGYDVATELDDDIPF